MKSKSKYIIFFLAVVFLIFSFLYIILDSKGENIIYSTKTPFKTDIVVKTIASGIIIPKDEVEIKSKVSGIVDEILVKPGERINKGTLMVTIKIIPNMVELSQAEARLKQAMIDHKSINEIHEKQNRLFLSDVISESEYFKFKTDYDKSREELSAAEDYLQLIKNGIRAGEKGVSNTLIKSSISGTIQDVMVKKGGVVIESNSFNEGTTIASIANMNEMQFEGFVSETEIGQIKPGDQLSLFIPAIKEDTLLATLDYISPKGGEVNGSIKFKLLASVRMPEKYFIRSGYSANAEIILDRKNRVLAIEEAWIKFENDEPYVEVEETAEVFKRKSIKLGISDGINSEVVSGINPGDKIKVQ